MYNGAAHTGMIAATLLVATLLVRPATGSANTVTDTASYARLLERFVTADGTVRYAALQADPADLDRFLNGIAATEPQQLEALPESDRIAFWVNAYNAITLKTIVDSYPIRASGFSALRYPVSSIRQISGAWSN